MKTFPMFLKIADRHVVVIGGGEQAAQKARLLLKTEARLILLTEDLDPELADLVRAGRAEHSQDPAIINGAALVFVATGCKGADASWHALAKQAGTVVNVVDYPALCDAMTPSIVDRDPVIVAIGTEGTAPVLGRRLKTRFEEILHPRLGAYAALAGRLRAEAAHRIPANARRDFWRWVFTGAPWRSFSSGQERGAARQIKDAMATGDRAEAGHLCLVLGAADPGLVPMAAVHRLQEADVIFCGRDVPNGVLELARRDAERVVANDADAVFSLGEVLSKTACRKSVVFLSATSTAPSIPTEESRDRVPVERILCGTLIQDTAQSHPALVEARQAI